MLAVVSEKSPWILMQLRKSQFELIQESKASNWAHALLP
jgi:hypothetical protein